MTTSSTNYLRYIPPVDYQPTLPANITSTASAYALAQQQQQQASKQANGQPSTGSSSSNPSLPIQDPKTRRLSPLADRPHSIEELARVATAGQLPEADLAPDLKVGLRYSEIYMHQALEDHESGDMEMAFVNYARAATMVAKRVTSHAQFFNMKEGHREMCEIRGDQCLENMEDLKPLVHEQFRLWRRQNPNAIQQLDLPRILHWMKLRDREEKAVRDQAYKVKKAEKKQASARQAMAGHLGTQSKLTNLESSHHAITSQASRDQLATTSKSHDSGIARRAYEEARRKQAEEIQRKSEVEIAEEQRRKRTEEFEALERSKKEREAAVALELQRQREEVRRHEQEIFARRQREAEAEAKRRELEEIRRREEEGRKREQGVRKRAEEEARQREEEARKRELEETKKREEEARRLEQEEAMRREEMRKQAEETRKREEEARRREEESRRREEESRRREEESRRREEEDKKREEETRKRQIEETRKREQEISARRQRDAQAEAEATRTKRGEMPTRLHIRSTLGSSAASDSTAVAPSTPDGLPVLPLESPTRVNNMDTRQPQPRQATAERTRKCAPLPVPPPLTTTSPPPKEAHTSLSYLMSTHQHAQGYAPSLQSMFIIPVPVPPTALLFAPNHPEGPSAKNFPQSPDRAPAHVRHLYAITHGLEMPQRRPSSDSRILLTDQIHGDEKATLYKPELKIVVVPNDVTTRFLSVAAVNTARNKETSGLLLGRTDGQKFRVTTLLIPKQLGTECSCVMEEEELVSDFTEKRKLITLGWIHTHPNQSCFLTSLDLHTHANFQSLLPEFFAIVCAPKYLPPYAVFRLTDPTGLNHVLRCADKAIFHPHDEHMPIYTDADKGHVVWAGDALAEIVDLR